MKAKYDIIYLVKESPANEELRYSLRSVCENFEFNKVWFYGGRPSYLMPDEYVHIVQNQANKWLRTTSMIKRICENPDITDNWWLFNDDFFILQKTSGIKAPCYEDLYKLIIRIENRHEMKSTLYTRQLRETVINLENRGLPVKNYAIHMPMLINKKKALAALEAFPKSPMFRSIYGNYNNIEGTEIKDCKIASIEREPDPAAVFLSTTDDSFERGKAGEFIRKRFPVPCRYER